MSAQSKNNFQLSFSSLSRREGVNSKLIEIDDLAITLTTIDYGHPQHAGLRTAEEQASLYRAGVSKADGYTSLSKHQSGRALDFYAYVDGKASWEAKHLVRVAAAFYQAASILGYEIEWGGLWKFKDTPHIQLGVNE